MTSDNRDKELVVRPRGTNGPNGGRPVVFPDRTVKRALLLMQETQSVASALHILEAELPAEQVPTYNTLWDWAQQHADVIGHLQGQEKRNMVLISSDVAREAAGRMIQALPGLSDSQIPVAYGIAMQRRTDWDKVGQAGTVQAVQFNVTVGGKKQED